MLRRSSNFLYLFIQNNRSRVNVLKVFDFGTVKVMIKVVTNFIWESSCKVETSGLAYFQTISMAMINMMIWAKNQAKFFSKDLVWSYKISLSIMLMLFWVSFFDIVVISREKIFFLLYFKSNYAVEFRLLQL